MFRVRGSNKDARDVFWFQMVGLSMCNTYMLNILLRTVLNKKITRILYDLSLILLKLLRFSQILQGVPKLSHATVLTI